MGIIKLKNVHKNTTLGLIRSQNKISVGKQKTNFNENLYLSRLNYSFAIYPNLDVDKQFLRDFTYHYTFQCNCYCNLLFSRANVDPYKLGNVTRSEEISLKIG